MEIQWRELYRFEDFFIGKEYVRYKNRNEIVSLSECFQKCVYFKGLLYLEKIRLFNYCKLGYYVVVIFRVNVSFKF